MYIGQTARILANNSGQKEENYIKRSKRGGAEDMQKRRRYTEI
jgi:hypothetical protein